MKAIAYARVSTAEQAQDGVSLSAQHEKLIGYAKLYDLNLVEVIADAGESAKTLERPGLQKALALLKGGKADGLIIAKLDRLTRSVADWQVLIDGYFGERRGKQLFSVGDSIDTRTAAGRLVLNVLLSVAQWEREAIGERTKDALQHKIRNRERVGRLRFGFDLDADGKMLVPNLAEQGVVELMHQLWSAGSSFRAIARELQGRGIAAKEGTVWTHITVAKILRRIA